MFNSSNLYYPSRQSLLQEELHIDDERYVLTAEKLKEAAQRRKRAETQKSDDDDSIGRLGQPAPFALSKTEVMMQQFKTVLQHPLAQAVSRCPNGIDIIEMKNFIEGGDIETFDQLDELLDFIPEVGESSLQKFHRKVKELIETK